jgi:hypothetical protein
MGFLCIVGENSRDRSLTRWMLAPLSTKKLLASGMMRAGDRTLREIMADISEGGEYPPGKKLLSFPLLSGGRTTAADA